MRRPRSMLSAAHSSPASVSMPSSAEARGATRRCRARDRRRLRGDPVRLGPLLVRPLELPEHPGRQAGGDQRAGAPTVGGRAGIGVEERRGVLAGGEVLAADVPVHPQVAAHLHARFAGSRVAAPRRGEERVERGLEVALLGDAALDASRSGRCPRCRRGSPRPSSAYRRACRSAISRRLARRPRAARAAYSPIVCSIRNRSLWPSTWTSALSTSDSSSSRHGLAGLGADGLDVGERAAAGEDRHAPEQPLLRLGEERVAPVDRGAQRLLPLGRVARAGGEHVERVVEPLEQRFRRQEPQPGGGELERERQAVEAPADGRDGGRVLGRQLERASSLGALDEQRDAGYASATRSIVRRGGSSSGASGYSRSAAIRSGVRLVVTIRSSGQRSTSRPTSGAAATTCSRLSRSRSAFLSPISATTPSPSVRSSASFTSSASARAGTKPAGSVTSASDDERDAVQELGREPPAELDDDARLPDAARAR